MNKYIIHYDYLYSFSVVVDTHSVKSQIQKAQYAHCIVKNNISTYKQIIETHFIIQCSFIYGKELVSWVFPGSLTHQTYGLFILQTEQLESLTVQTAEHFRPSWSPLTLLLQERLTYVPQRQIQWRIVQWRLSSTNWTLFRFLLSPELLKAVFAEAVTAQKKDGILENVKANRTGEILFR